MLFLWYDAIGFISHNCSLCSKLYGFSIGDKELKTLFKKESTMEKVLRRHGFNTKERRYENGIFTFEKRKFGNELIRELRMELTRSPRITTTSDIRRLKKNFIDVYGETTVRHAIFLYRFRIINLDMRKELSYRYGIEYVPAFITPYAPFGKIQGVSAKEPEEEFEKLLFLGGSKIRPIVEVATPIFR